MRIEYGGAPGYTEAMPRPTTAEAALHYFTYINHVPEGNIAQILADQLESALALLRGVSEVKSLHRYADGKWSIRECLNHINDSERIFAHRLHWFARGYTAPLEGFDQEVAIAHSAADSIPWATHMDEFRAIRQATLALVNTLPEAAWMREGIASGNPITVNALAYAIAGHAEHHLGIIRERYL
jgi:uncharacterized damage-inducible protein DinB